MISVSLFPHWITVCVYVFMYVCLSVSNYLFVYLCALSLFWLVYQYHTSASQTRSSGFPPRFGCHSDCWLFFVVYMLGHVAQILLHQSSFCQGHQINIIQYSSHLYPMLDGPLPELYASPVFCFMIYCQESFILKVFERLWSGRNSCGSVSYVMIEARRWYDR